MLGLSYKSESLPNLVFREKNGATPIVHGRGGAKANQRCKAWKRESFGEKLCPQTLFSVILFKPQRLCDKLTYFWAN